MVFSARAVGPCVDVFIDEILDEVHPVRFRALVLIAPVLLTTGVIVLVFMNTVFVLEPPEAIPEDNSLNLSRVPVVVSLTRILLPNIFKGLIVLDMMP